MAKTWTQPLEYRLETVTPLWTGSADSRKMNRIEETGLLGGLRFWTGALLRSLGHNVCQDRTCSGDKPCDLCSLFGCTGLSRSFRLEVAGPDRMQRCKGTRIEIPRNDGKNRRSRWFLKEGIQANTEFTMRFIPLRPADPQHRDILRLTMALVTSRAGLGAQTQYGYGLVRIRETGHGTEPPDGLIAGLDRSPSGPVHWHDLRRFCFFEGVIKDNARPKTLFKLRSRVRNGLRRIRGMDYQQAADLRHRFCGSLHGPKKGKPEKGKPENNAVASCFHLGRHDRDRAARFRGWAWFRDPQTHRDTCLDLLHRELRDISQKGTFQWLESGSKRHTGAQAADWPESLGNLLARV